MENIQTIKAHDPGETYPEPADEPEVDNKDKARFDQVSAWWSQERDAQAENRFKMSRCQDFVDNDQWSDEDRAELEQRGQPALVFNLIGTSVRWITGTEKRTRADYRVIGRGKEDTDSAENKTALLKYLNDVNRGGYHRSRAFEDAVGAGIGWIEVGIRGDEGQEPLFERYENWRNVWPDRLATEPDYSDGRYIFRAKWVDLDTAKAYFPEHVNALELAAEDHEQYYSDDEFDNPDTEMGYQQHSVGTQVSSHANRRLRVRLIECWYRQPEQCEVIRGNGTCNGAILSNDDPRLTAMAQEMEVYKAVKQVMRLMIFVSGRNDNAGQMVYHGRSPYWHNRFPLVPVRAYTRKRTNLPYGPVESMLDPQIDLNKRKSKALFILSTNQVIMDKGAVDDVNILAEEVARPDGIIEKNIGKTLEIRNDKALAQQHVNMMDQSAQYIQRAGGITDENLGRQTNATSGKAITARQEQGTTVTYDLFDNLRLAMQITGELKLSLIEQYYTEEKVVRILGERGKTEFRTLNDSPENSITESQADFIVDEQAFNVSARRAMFEELFDMVGKLPPEIAFKLLDVVVDMSDLPERELLVSRIRELNGMRGDEEPTPEEQAAQQQEQAVAQEKQARVEEANMKMLEGQAEEATYKALSAKIEAMVKKMDIMQKALNAAAILGEDPLLGQGADTIIEDASNLV